jgi:hypothetical protein
MGEMGGNAMSEGENKGVDGWITGIVSKTDECGEGYVEVTMILQNLYPPIEPHERGNYLTEEEHTEEGKEWKEYDKKRAEHEARRQAKELLHLGHARIYQIEDGMIQG